MDRLSTDRPVVNRWLWFLGLVGTAIVTIDGFSRQVRVAEEIVPLTYVPSAWVVAFALVTMPMCLLYALKTYCRVTEGVLFWFVLATVTYAKEFAYIRVPWTPLFVSDSVLLYLGIQVLRTGALGRFFLASATAKYIGAFFVAGAVAMVRGLLAEEETLYVLRDSAIPVYASFFFASALLLRGWRSIQCLLAVLAIGAVLSTVHGLAWMVAEPGQRRYIGYGVYVLAGFLGTVLAITNKRLPSQIGWPLAALTAAGVLLANARTIYVSLVALLVVVVLFGVSMQSRGSIAARCRVVFGVLVAVITVLTIASQTQSGGDLIARASTELVSGVAESEHDPNAQFRFLAWEEAIARFVANPLVGEGYGVPFVFERSDMDVRPHNTYLTVLYKMGLVGTLPLLLTVAGFHWIGWRALHRHRSHSTSVLLYILLVAHLTMCLFGALNLLLESPFLSSVFWILMGAGARSVTLFRVTLSPAQQGRLARYYRMQSDAVLARP